MCSLGAAFQRTQPDATGRNRTQPDAIGRKRPFERKFAVPLGSFTGIVMCGHFTCLQPSFRVAGVALRDMWTFWATCGQSFFEASAILLRRFHNMGDILRGRRSTLDVSDSIFRGRRSTSRVVLRVFRKSHWHGCAQWQPRANSVAGVAFRDMCQNWRKSRTKCSF